MKSYSRASENLEMELAERNRQPVRAVVAEMRELIKWPEYDQTDAFRFHKVINELTLCRCTSSVCSQRQPSQCREYRAPAGMGFRS